VPENLLDHLGLMPLDEGNDLHLGAALGVLWLIMLYLE
jgi:hypothetical protein